MLDGVPQLIDVRKLQPMTSARASVFLSAGWGGGWGECFLNDNLDRVRYECIALSLGCSGGVP